MSDARELDDAMQVSGLPQRCVREHACLVEMTTLRDERDALRDRLYNTETVLDHVEAENAALRARLSAAREDVSLLRAQLDNIGQVEGVTWDVAWTTLDRVEAALSGEGVRDG